MSLKDLVGHIEIEVDNDDIKRFPLYEGVNIVGRNVKKSNVVIEQKQISDVHGQIICQDGKVKILDLSKNGIYLNENRVEKGKQVQIDLQNQTVYFGTFKCVFKMGIKNQSQGEMLIKNKGNFEENRVILESKDCNSDGGLKQDMKKDGKMEKEKKKESKEKVGKMEEKKVSKKSGRLENKRSGNLSKQKGEEQEDVEIEIRDGKQKKQKRGSRQKILREKEKIKEDVNQNSNMNFTQKSESKQKRKRKSTRKQDDQRNVIRKENKIQKQSDEQQTKVKSKGRRRAKSSYKVQQNGIILNRKKVNELPNINFNSYPRRTIIFKKVLLSGFILSFNPTVKIKIVENWRDHYDLLVMDRYSRTFKLLYSICLGIPVVSIKWIIHAQYNRSIPSPDNFPLECQHKFTIVNSVKASQEGKKVFDKLSFYIIETKEAYHMPLEQIECLIEAGGGKVIKKNIKKQVTKETIFITKIEPDQQDRQCLGKIEQARRIYTVELILKSCLHQNIEWEQNKVNF